MECDVLVVGSGAGALSAALIAATAGLSTIVIEKTDLFGGTTAYSGGGLWIPLSEPIKRAGVEDEPERVERYLDATVGTERRYLRDAYLRAGSGVIAELEENPWLEFEWRPFPDYFGEAPGAHPEGRSIYALDFDATRHEPLLQHLRQPLRPEKGGWREPYPTIIGGRAFLARLLVALSETDAVLLRQTELQELIKDGPRVAGAQTASGEPIHSTRGVLLAAGGFERNSQLRQKYQPPLGSDWTLGAPGNTGSPLEAAMAVGAGTELLEECWWAPGLMLPDGTASFRLFERGKPGSIMVDSTGERFANETWPYDRLGRAIVERQNFPCWFIVDQPHVDRYGFGTARPGRPISEDWFETNTIVRADTLDDLAVRTDVPRGTLTHTVHEFNRYAANGIDEQFHRGELAFDRFFGDHDHEPNSNLGPVDTAPFYVWKVMPADLGTKGGIRCDESARALRPDGSVIPGLFAAGNTMASWTNHCYPGPGSPIGSCVVFSVLAARRMIADAPQ